MNPRLDAWLALMVTAIAWIVWSLLFALLTIN